MSIPLLAQFRSTLGRSTPYLCRYHQFSGEVIRQNFGKHPSAEGYRSREPASEIDRWIDR